MIVVLPERLARGYEDRFRIFDPPLEMPPFAIVEVWHDRTHRDPALVWLRQALADLTREEGAAPATALRRRAAARRPATPRAAPSAPPRRSARPPRS
jgi:hypothetical protein